LILFPVKKVGPLTVGAAVCGGRTRRMSRLSAAVRGRRRSVRGRPS